MREIKFRAYERDLGRMLNVNLIDFDDEFLRVWDEYGEDEEEWSLKHCDIVQYTGEKDVNGVEIYDLDIVEGGIEGRRTLVDIDSIGWLRRALRDPFNKKYCNYKVIGNKFQNPELLEGTK